jgi:hypothetical protein
MAEDLGLVFPDSDFTDTGIRLLQLIAPQATLAQARAQARRTATSNITYFLENDGTHEAAQRIAGHADSRTTKLDDHRDQKVLLEDMDSVLAGTACHGQTLGQTLIPPKTSRPQGRMVS